VFLRHVLDALDAVLEFSKGLDETDFKKDKLIQAGVIQKLEVMGEATKRLSAKFKVGHPEVAWRRIAGMRDKLIHDYLGVDLDLVWRVVQNDLPELRRKIKAILDIKK
jgi:uncharacterized protein with HEPN domain